MKKIDWLRIMNKNRKWITYCLALLLIVFVYGAIPFFSIPTLGQVVWTSGFAESFANSGWPSIKAVNFGLPHEAAISFGLAGAFLQSTFIANFGMHASDAYALGAVLWLALALYGTNKLCRFLGASFVQAAFLSLIYLTLPLVWVHADYSMVSFGFALLPLYLFMGFSVVYHASDAQKVPREGIIVSISFCLCSLLAVFMDGYTYLMFFVASSLVWMIAFARKDNPRKILLLQVLPVIIGSAVISTLLYSKFEGVSYFPLSSLDFFRGWGVDVVMLLVPTRGILWLWDTLGISVLRSQEIFFGDSSVWKTTFALPLIITGGLGFWLARKHRLALPLLVIALMGFYLSLGPSLKVNSVRPLGGNGEMLVTGPEMPKDTAIAPTGSAFLDEYILGFNNMRAAYRWSGLMFVGLLGLTVLFFLAASSRGYKLLSISVIAFLVISNLPDLPHRLEISKKYRNAMFTMDRNFADLSNYIGEGSVVFFVPFGNDFIVNYLASTGNYHAYNIGGDKNLRVASQDWPNLIRAFPVGEIGECFQSNIIPILQENLAKFVVIPYFDMLEGAYIWPFPENQLEIEREKYFSTVNYFKNDPSFAVLDDKLYAVISLSPTAANSTLPGDVGLHLGQIVSFTGCESSSTVTSFFGDGWYNFESSGVWSSKNAEMVFAIPVACQNVDDYCSLHISFNVFNASPASPQTVQVDVGGAQVANWIVTSSEVQQHLIPLRWDPLKETGGEIKLGFQIPNATSPADLGLSSDSRVLGIGLIELELMKNTEK